MPLSTPAFEMAPWRLSGVVYGVLMNDPQRLARLGDAASLPPYKAPPKAPVMYLKPRNTLAAAGSAVAGADEFELGAALGLVVGRTAGAVSAGAALQHVAGCLLVADLCLPHDSFYRPSVRQRARDGSCLLGPRVAAVNPDAVTLRVMVDGEVVQRIDTGSFIRRAAVLLADVTEFMTLRPGDLLLTGLADGAPRLRRGQSFAIEADGLGVLEGSVA